MWLLNVLLCSICIVLGSNGLSQFDRIEIPPVQDSSMSSEGWKYLLKKARLAKRDHTVVWGKSSKTVFCPENMFLWGYSIQKNPNKLIIERIDFFCHEISSESFHPSQMTIISSNFNVTVDPKRMKTELDPKKETVQICEYHNGPIVAYKLIYENSRITNYNERGVTGFQGICADGKELKFFRSQNNIENYSYFKLVNATCGSAHIGCGFQLRFQVEGYNGENRGVVDADIACCSYTKAIETCEFRRSYKVIASVDNRENEHGTTERMVITRSIEINQRLSKTQSESWDKMHSSSITKEFIQSNSQTVSRSESENFFDRNLDVVGMLKSVGDIMNGLTKFVKKGVGKLMNSAGLGELLQAPRLPKLLGENGFENLLNLGEDGLKYYFENTPLEPIMKSDLGGAFSNLDNLAENEAVQKVSSFKGFDYSLGTMKRLFARKWKGEKIYPKLSEIMSDSLTKLIDTDKILTYKDMSVLDVLGLYGLVKAYGRVAIEKALRSGELAKSWNIGNLEKKNWNDGIGKILTSGSVEKLFNVYTIAKTFEPSTGIGIKFKLGEKLNIDGIEERSQLLKDSPLFTEIKFNDTIWGETITFYAIYKIMDSNSSDPFVQAAYENSMLQEIYGSEGFHKIIDTNELSNWYEPVSNFTSDDQKILFKLFSMIGIKSIADDLAKTLSSTRYRKTVGSNQLSELLGSQFIKSEQEIFHLACLYVLNEAFGDLENVSVELEGSKGIDWKTAAIHNNFGDTFGIFAIGKLYSLASFSKITGGRYRALASIQTGKRNVVRRSIPSKFSSTRSKRSILGAVGGLFTTFLSSATSFLSSGQLFSGILGSGRGGGVKRNTRNEESVSLRERYSKRKTNQIRESVSNRNQLSYEFSISQSNSTTETIENFYRGNFLTLVASPKLDCDDFYSVDLIDRRNFITIEIPNAKNCTPITQFRIIRELDYLNTNTTESRYLNVIAGIEWYNIHLYTKRKGLKETILKREPTRGFKQRIQSFKNDLQGQENLLLSQILTKDLDSEGLWKDPEMFEHEQIVYGYNYNIFLQLQLKCGQMVLYSAHPQLIRFPKVFHCKPKEYYETLPSVFDKEKGRSTYQTVLGLRRAGKDISKLNKYHRALPQIYEQLIRILKEMQIKFVNENVRESSGKGDSEFNWKRDITLLRNPSWDLAVTELDYIDIQTNSYDKMDSVKQLIAKCGPFEVALKKYKVTLKKITGEKYEKIIPEPILTEETNLVNDADEECYKHFPC